MPSPPKKRYIVAGRIEFPVTYRCNSKCRHCYLDGTVPIAGAVDPDLAVSCIHKVCAEHPVTSVMTFGGEPLLFHETVCAIHAAARDEGVEIRQLITNAGVPRDAGKGRDVVRQLHQSGVNNVQVSADVFHQEFVSTDIVERNVGYMLEAGITTIKWNPCWVEAPDADNRYNKVTRSILERLAHLGVPTGSGNVALPQGAAVRELAEFLPAPATIPGGSCRDVPFGTVLDRIDSITIEPNADVTICPEWRIGNAAAEDICGILDRYDPHTMPEAVAILGGGMEALVGMSAKAGLTPDADGYYSICDMCTALRRALNDSQVTG
jgi:hypothetical protein